MMFPKSPRARKHKYGAKKTSVDGHLFPSALEASVYSLLKLRVMQGELLNLQMQKAVTLKEKCAECGDGPVVWKVDFAAIQRNGEPIYIEAKGAETADFKKRKKLWKKNPPATLEIWKGSARYPRLTEVIAP